MYHRWLDQWDERRALRGEGDKKPAHFVLGAKLAFPRADRTASLQEFCALADQAVANPAFFEEPSENDQSFQRQGALLKFPSDISTDIAENNVVWAEITDSALLIK